MTDKIVVLSTCDSEEEARAIARALVESKTAACVSVLPGLESHYQWQGKVETSQEWLLIIKTRRSLYEKLQAELRKVHSYEVPELIALPVVEGLPAYLDWIDAETSSPGE